MADSKSGTFVFGHYDASQSGWYAHMFTLLGFVEAIWIGPQDGLSSSDFSKLHTSSLDTEWLP